MTIDCETDPFKKGRMPKPFIWCVYDGSSPYLFYSTDKFVDFLKELEVTAFCHNGGRFDFHFLLDYVNEGDSPVIINGRLGTLKIGAAKVADSFLLIPEKLAAYKKDDFDYSLLEKEVRNIKENKQKIENYIISDCVYLHELISTYHESFGDALTLASNAMKYFTRMAGLKYDQIHSSKSFDALFRQFYKGGRVECFEKGVYKIRCKGFDINSAYPYIMRQEIPFGFNYNVSSKIPDCPEKIKKSFIVANVTSKKALPTIDPNKKTLIFPFIRDELFMTGFELLAGLETKTIDVHKVKVVYTFKDSINFTDYIDHFYKMKKDSEKGSGEYLISKRFMNALYGKWASNPEKYKNYLVVASKEIKAYLNVLNSEIDKPELLSQFVGFLTKDKALISYPLSPEQFNNNLYNVATGAAITGGVRAMLWKQITQCERPLYCDTDSITTVDGNFDIGDEIGQWEKEGDYDQVAIAGKKLYAFRKIKGTYKIGEKKYKTACKGFKLTPKEIQLVANGEQLEVINEVPVFKYCQSILDENRKPTFDVTKKNYFPKKIVKMT